MGKHGGLSSRVNVRVSRNGRSVKQQKRTLNVTGAAKARNDAQIQARLAGLSTEQRELMHGNDFADYEAMDVDDPQEKFRAMMNIPAGDEGTVESSAGGELEICQEILDQLHVTGKRFDPRTRRDRTHLNNIAWSEQMEALVDAYLLWRRDPLVTEAGGYEDTRNLEIATIDFFYQSTLSVVLDAADRYPNVSIAQHGYLGTSPRNPTTAIAFEVLEAYRQLHRVCPKLSIYAQVQALCHLHGRPFNRSFVEQFSGSFDVYLEILHRVDTHVNVRLRRDSSEWRLRHACPPCMYTLENEPALALSLLCSMDGNSSLKLVDSSVRYGSPCQDERTHHIKDLFLLPEAVNKFKDEVVSSASSKAPAVQHGDDASVEQTTSVLSTADCVEKWRAAAPEERKRAFALFHTTGVFASFCRHVHPLVFCDMIRSGELRKYALAVIDKLMSVFGQNIGLAYDIGCDTWKTILNSSLRDRAIEQNLRLIVPAFHGHQHNRLCQLDWHPMYINGAGKEDFEGCERAFKDSNMLASGTRLASAFHRHQAIEQHWAFRSLDKHADSGTFLLHNYQQALGIIQKDGADLRNLFAKLGTTPADFAQYLKDEKAYLQGLKAEPEELSLRLEYLESLEALDEAQYRANTASLDRQKLDLDMAATQVRGATITAVKNRYRHTWKKLEDAEDHTAALETRLSLEERWTPADRAYQEAKSEMVMRKYRLALDKLEHLVVQRLLELTKISMGGIAYKLREKIGQALRTRAEAIRKALDEYNKQATLLTPPRPKLRWEELINMSSIGDFDLLRNARQDIRQLEWAKPVHREATRLHFNVVRAQEELLRCNVEIRRLLTAIPTSCPRAVHAWAERDRINATIAQHLLQISRLPGFTGELKIGRHVSRDELHPHEVPAPAWVATLGLAAPDQDWIDIDEEDEDGDSQLRQNQHAPLKMLKSSLCSLIA
ncbi:hypothetical protein BC835DRAFT_1412678 [Cytidiella melzeri]|nr:hypothetical protein BC835DRAFT_1412678 [Cytidiella melzeri]